MPTFSWPILKKDESITPYYAIRNRLEHIAEILEKWGRN